jgi:methylphosphotriester-DNA--protein-cysteine methyltransferase
MTQISGREPPRLKRVSSVWPLRAGPLARTAIQQHEIVRFVAGLVEAERTNPDLSLAWVAPHVGLTPTDLSRLLRRTAGEPWRTWIMRDRVWTVVHQLSLEPRVSLSYAARCAGFGCERSMERAFCAIVRRTAKNFRAEMRLRVLRPPGPGR